MMAWVRSESHCGLGPVFQENRDPKSIELLFQMVHTSVITKFTIVKNDKEWLERPVIALQTTLRDSEVIWGIKSYMDQKGWPETFYTGNCLKRNILNLVMNIKRLRYNSRNKARIRTTEKRLSYNLH